MCFVIFIYPLIARVVGAPQMISQPVFFHFSLLSTAVWDLPNSRPVYSLMLSSPFHCALQNVYSYWIFFLFAVIINALNVNGNTIMLVYETDDPTLKKTDVSCIQSKDG